MTTSARRRSWPTQETVGRIACGLALGLYLGRVVAESVPFAWRWWQLLPIPVFGAAVGLATTLWVLRHLTVGPLALTLIYVLWPLPSQQAALLIGVAAVVAWLVSNRIGERYTLWHAGILGLLALSLYLCTLAPDLQPADAGEFQVAAATLGIAHPPGYPLYTLLGKLFTLLPGPSAAWSLNLFAALCAALCVAVVVHAVGRTTGVGWAALIAGASLAVIPTFWVQGTLANIRSLTALLLALAMAQALRWARTRQTRDLTLLGLVLGLGIGHHSSLALLLPALVAFVLLHEPRIILQPRRWLGMLGAALASLLVILYLPLRSSMSPAFALSTVDSWDDLVAHVLATGFRGDMLRYTSIAALWRRAGALAQLMHLEHGYLLLALALPALIVLLIRRPRQATLVGGAWVLNVLSVLTYSAPQTVEYLIPSYVAFALILGLGLAALPRPERLRAPIVALAAIAILTLGQSAWPGLQSLHTNDSTSVQAEALLESAPEDSLILSGWHQATPLWYLQLVEGRRSDITVTYVYPEGATPNAEVWLRRITEALPERPVVVTNRFHAFEQRGLLLEPLAEGWLVRAEPRVSSEDALHGPVFGERLSLSSWQATPEAVQPGQSLRLDLELAALQEIDDDYTAFAQLIGPTGVVAQADQLVHTSQLAEGQALRLRLEPTVLTHCPPGDYQLIFGLYGFDEAGIARLATADGDSVSLGTVHIAPRQTPTVNAHPVDWQLSDGLRIYGLDADHSIAGVTRLYVHLSADKVLSDELTLLASSNGTPIASVAIPRLAAGEYALLALDLAGAPGEITLTVQQGATALPSLGPWHSNGAADLTVDVSRLGERYVPLGDEMVLTGWSGACSETRCTLSVELLAQQALTHDDSISLGVRGNAEVKSDGTPVTGALPTLKWLPGWRIVDDQELDIDAGVQPTNGILTVYDSFTLKTLPVLDERLALSGQGTELLLPLAP